MGNVQGFCLMSRCYNTVTTSVLSVLILSVVLSIVKGPSGNRGIKGNTGSPGPKVRMLIGKRQHVYDLYMYVMTWQNNVILKLC